MTRVEPVFSATTAARRVFARGAGTLLTAAMALAAFCEAPGERSERRTSGASRPDAAGISQPRRPVSARTEPAPPASRWDPQADLCENLCALRGACFDGYAKVALDPILYPLTPPEREPCLARCRRVAGDSVLGGFLRPQVAQCLRGRLAEAPRSDDCDTFLGCSLRIRLQILQAEPWRRSALEARRLMTTVQELVAAGNPAGAMARCREDGGVRRALGAVAQGGREGSSANAPAQAGPREVARETLAALDRHCLEAWSAARHTLARHLEEAVRELRLAEARAACDRLRVLGVPEGVSEPQAAQNAETSRACQTIDSLQAVAMAVADAEADSALVRRELDRGGDIASGYLKCVYKASTLGTLESSNHPRARAAAKTLRTVCFERFPVEWLREVQRRGGGPDRALCFRIQGVARLLMDPGTPSRLKEQSSALVKWATEACR